MCFGGGGGSSSVDTSGQEAELRRQTNIVALQMQLFQLQQQKQAYEQRAADDQRYAQQRADDLAEAERQRVALEQQLATQRGLTEEANRKAEELRVLTEARATAKAERDRVYAQGRETLINDSSQAVEDTYGNFDDNYFGEYKTNVLDSLLPSIEKEYTDTRRSTRLGLAENGNLNSSAAARLLGDLAQDYETGRGAAAKSADDLTSQLRDQIDQQKRDALAGIINAAGVAGESLPDGVTDVQGALNGVAGRLASYINGLQTSVASHVPLAGRATIAAPTVTLNQQQMPQSGGGNTTTTPAPQTTQQPTSTPTTTTALTSTFSYPDLQPQIDTLQTQIQNLINTPAATSQRTSILDRIRASSPFSQLTGLTA